MVEVFTPGKLYTPASNPLTVYHHNKDYSLTIRPGTACFLVLIEQDMAGYIRAQYKLNYAPEQLRIPHIFLIGENMFKAWIARARHEDWDEYDENWAWLTF